MYEKILNPISHFQQEIDVRPLPQREPKMNTRKGFKVCPGKTKPEERDQLIFDNSQRNCNGYIPDRILLADEFENLI
jgi:hypothetical protein